MSLFKESFFTRTGGKGGIKNNKKPSVLILNTIKGKGIKKFENDPVWHARKLSAKDILIGRKDLKSKL